MNDMPRNPSSMNEAQRQEYNRSGADRAKQWREENKAYAADYQRMRRARQKAAQAKPDRGYHLAECSGKCPFWQGCSMWRLEITQALPVRENLSGQQIRHLARPLPCQAE
jgi:hypothetical protein